MKKIMMKVALVLCLLASLVPLAENTASAFMYPVYNPASMQIVTYPLDKNTRSITAYRNPNLTNKTGTVYGTDNLVILAAQGNVVNVKFPTSNGPKYGWIPLSTVAKGNLNTSYSLAMRANAPIPMYRYETGAELLGQVDTGDVFYLTWAGLDHENGRAELIYPTSNGWKMGFARFFDIGNAWCRAVGGGRTVQDGRYRIRVSDSHCLDGFNEYVHTWENLDVSQQYVDIKHQNNGQYTVRFANNGKLLTHQNGVKKAGTQLFGSNDGSDASRWYIADLGQNRYELFNVQSGLALDVEYYRTTSNGTPVLGYYYNGQSVRLSRNDGGQVANTSLIAVASPTAAAPSSNSSRAAKMIEAAKSQLNVRYKFGANQPGVQLDCSSFVSYAANQAGYNVGRQTAQGLYNLSDPVSTPVPGDLVFFTGTYHTSNYITHVGIYLGNGQMIHCGVGGVCYRAVTWNMGSGHLVGYGRLR